MPPLSDDWAQKLGSLIKLSREHLDWTQADLADRIGSDQKTISRLETGLTDRPNAAALLAVLTVLQMPRRQVAEVLGLNVKGWDSDALITLMNRLKPPPSKSDLADDFSDEWQRNVDYFMRAPAWEQRMIVTMVNSLIRVLAASHHEFFSRT